MKKLIGVIVIIAVLAVGGWLIFGHKTNTTTDSMTGMDMSPSATPASSSDQTPQATSSVTIQNFAFSPAAITVKKGTTVTWTNQDSTEHTVTETDGQTGPQSGSLGNGKTYTFAYNTAGTFHYHCSIHSEMTGTVTVTE